MMTVTSWSLSLEDLDRNQIYRHLVMRPEAVDSTIRSLTEACVPGFLAATRPRASWMEVPVSLQETQVDFGVFSVKSNSLARTLRGCDRAILFAATLGAETDRQRRTASVTSPAKALILDAMGTAAIETVCDGLCCRFAAEHPERKLRPRFSPGYGDLPLECQRTLLDVLDSQRKAGISLSESLLMVPQKSVSAIVGLGRQGCRENRGNCEECLQKDCEFRL